MESLGKKRHEKAWQGKTWQGSEGKAWKVKESEGVEHVFQVMINNVVIGKIPMERQSTLVLDSI